MNCITFREDIPSWDSYFMGLAKFASSRRSKNSSWGMYC